MLPSSAWLAEKPQPADRQRKPNHPDKSCQQGGHQFLNDDNIEVLKNLRQSLIVFFRKAAQELNVKGTNKQRGCEIGCNLGIIGFGQSCLIGLAASPEQDCTQNNRYAEK